MAAWMKPREPARPGTAAVVIDDVGVGDVALEEALLLLQLALGEHASA